MISNVKYLYIPHTRSLNPVSGLKWEKTFPFQFCLFFYSSTKNAKKSPQVAPKALKMVLISQKPLDIWFLGKSQWKKIFLITNFKVSKRGRKNNENGLVYFRLVLTTRKGSNDKCWCFVSNGGSIWWQQCLAFLCRVHLSVISSQLDYLK